MDEICNKASIKLPHAGVKLTWCLCALIFILITSSFKVNCLLYATVLLVIIVISLVINKTLWTNPFGNYIKHNFIFNPNGFVWLWWHCAAAGLVFLDGRRVPRNELHFCISTTTKLVIPYLRRSTIIYIFLFVTKKVWQRERGRRHHQIRQKKSTVSQKYA